MHDLRDHIAYCGYHGWHDWFIANTDLNSGIPEFNQGLAHSFNYNDLDSLQQIFDQNPDEIACVIMEPLTVLEPQENFLEEVKKIAHHNGALLIFDEVQSGIGRTGKMLCCDHYSFKPDILILGKALSGGVFPVSAVLSSDEVMLTIKPGEHGSTFGGNPLACEVAIAALNAIISENMIDNAGRLGEVFRKEINNFIKTSTIAKLVRGKGLLNAIVINDAEDGDTAWNICMSMANKGLLAKPTHGNII